MKARLLIAALVIGLVGCERRNEPNKLIDGIPVRIGATVVPAQAAQQYLFLQRDLLTVLIPVINKIVNADSQFPELTALGGGVYRFQASDDHYGVATFTIAFQDANGAAIDPVDVDTRASSSTFKSVAISITGTSSLFAYSKSEALTLESAGVIDSARQLSGTASFVGVNDAAGYTLSFDLPAPGGTAIFEGLTAGRATATGSGGTPAAPAAMTMFFAPDRAIDGTVSWEGNEGTFHLEADGPGYVVTSQNRILLD